MSRAKKRADRIRSAVPIARVLSDYGFNVRADGGDREQQFSCNLHGGGLDLSPSARAYPDSNSAYCFGCGRTRDAIQYAREKEGLDFWGAIKVLELRYHLPPLPWDDEDDAPPEATLPERVRDILKSEATLDDVRARVKRRLEILTAEREVPLPNLLTLWEAFDRACHGLEKGDLSEGAGKGALLLVLDKAQPKSPQ